MSTGCPDRYGVGLTEEEISESTTVVTSSSKVACWESKILMLSFVLFILIFRPKKICGDCEYSTFSNLLSFFWNVLSTSGDSEKNIKSSTYKPKYKGGLFFSIVPVNKHSEFAQVLSPRDRKTAFAF